MKLLRPFLPLVFVVVLCGLFLPGSSPLLGQSAQSAVPRWQMDAGGKMAFDVASVKRDTVVPSPETVHVNVPLDAMDDFTPTGGLFSAKNVSLQGYIMFAYKLTAFETKALYESLPNWTNTRFDIEARALTTVNPTKDQFRLMMQALLAERFKLAVHYETKQLPAMALVLDKPGKLGPKIQQRPADEPCSSELSSGSRTTGAGYPRICGVFIFWLDGGRMHGGGRNLDLQPVASALTSSAFGIDRPVLDRTGLTGRYDLVFEFIPQTMPPGTQLDESGPTFLEALKDQLGLKMVPTTGPVDVLVVDHVEEPSPN
jgi:uncharacterized protein (TIGR03435 family)